MPISTDESLFYKSWAEENDIGDIDPAQGLLDEEDFKEFLRDYGDSNDKQ